MGYNPRMMVEPSFESTTPMTQRDFAEWVRGREAWDPYRHELLNGRVVMSPPAGYPHGSIEARIQRLVGTHVEAHNLGEVFGSSQGFELPSGDTVEPDCSFVSRERWQAIQPPEAGRFLRVVPDLVVEILSESTASHDRGEKKAIYERNGVSEYWLVDPNSREVTVLTLRDAHFITTHVARTPDRISSTVFPDLDAPVDRVFPS